MVRDLTWDSLVLSFRAQREIYNLGFGLLDLAALLRLTGTRVSVPSLLCRIETVNTLGASLADAATLFQGNIRHLVNLGKRFFNCLLSLFHLYPQFRPRGIDVRLLHRLA